MKIDIASRDERYKYLSDLLNKSGYNSRVVSSKEISFPDVLILPIKREHSSEELLELAKRVSKDTRVLYGGDELIRQVFKCRLDDYSKNEYFLKENARITAEAFLSVWQKETRASLYGKRLLISGYGRIGKYLSNFLSNFGAEIYVYARRNEIKSEIENDGFVSVEIDYAPQTDAVINTAPAVVFEKNLIEKIPESTHLFELASVCGFEDTKRVVFALGLPGKILPESAGKAIYNSVVTFLD